MSANCFEYYQIVFFKMRKFLKSLTLFVLKYSNKIEPPNEGATSARSTELADGTETANNAE